MRVAQTTGLVALICLIGGISAASAVWVKYQALVEQQGDTEQLTLADRDYRQIQSLTNQWFVGIDLFFDGAQSYAASSVARQARELDSLLVALMANTEVNFEDSRDHVAHIAASIARLSITGPNDKSWESTLARVDDMSYAVVESIELATSNNQQLLARSSLTLAERKEELTHTSYFAASIYMLSVLLGWVWANRKIVVPLQRLERSSRSEGDEIAADLSSAPLELRQLGNTLEDYSKKILKRQSTIEAQNVQLESQLAEIQRTRDKLIQAEKLASVGQLAAGVAHEINNPMAFVSTNITNLEQACSSMIGCLKAQNTLLGVLDLGQPLDTNQLADVLKLWDEADIDFLLEDIDEIFSDCQEGTSRITSIVRQLSDFTEASVSSSQCDLQAIMAETVEKIGSTKFTIHATSDVHVWCPETRLKQAMDVICQNALEAHGDREDPIEISIGHTKIYGWVQVKDNGPGIDPELQAKIFDPFFTTKDVGKGIGLGLHFAQSTAHQAEGELSIESIMGEGAAFRMALPLHNQQSADAA